MNLAITSTVKNAPQSVARCVRSVRDQSHRDWTHTIVAIDEATRESAKRAADGDPRFLICGPSEPDAPICKNLRGMWADVSPQTPIVWLDGDDWLAIPHALAIVSAAHTDGALATYGQFIMTDGSPGFARQAGPHPRREQWGASHLKTFRAGLVHRIRNEDLRDESGDYSRYVPDLRVMFACLEMAGKRAVFLDNVLVVYNIERSFWATATPALRQIEARQADRVRSFEPYALIEDGVI